jgi:hypothetical protein
MSNRKNKFVPYHLVEQLYQEGFTLPYGEDFGTWRLYQPSDLDELLSNLSSNDEKIVFRERGEDLYRDCVEICKAPMYWQVLDFAREVVGFCFNIIPNEFGNYEIEFQASDGSGDVFSDGGVYHNYDEAITGAVECVIELMKQSKWN